MSKTDRSWVLPAAQRVSWVTSRVSSVFVILMIALVVVEVILRKIFNSSTLICDEYTGYFQLTIIFWGLAAGVSEKRHIKVDIVVNALPAALRIWFELATNLIGLMFTSVAIWAASKMAVDSFLFKATSVSPSHTLLFIPQFIMVFGLIAFFMQLCVRIYEIVQSRTRPESLEY